MFAAGKRGCFFSHLTQKGEGVISAAPDAAAAARISDLWPRQRGVPAVCAALAEAPLQQRVTPFLWLTVAQRRGRRERTNAWKLRQLASINLPQPLLGPLPGGTSRDFTEMPHRLRSCFFFFFRVRFAPLCRCAARCGEFARRRKQSDKQAACGQADPRGNVIFELPRKHKLYGVHISRVASLKVTFFPKMPALSTRLGFSLSVGGAALSGVAYDKETNQPSGSQQGQARRRLPKKTTKISLSASHFQRMSPDSGILSRCHPPQTIGSTSRRK